MGRIPHDHRGEHGERQRRPEIGPGRPEPATLPRRYAEPQEGPDTQKRSRIFCEQPEAAGRARGGPPDRALGLRNLGQGENEERRGGHRRGIRRCRQPDRAAHQGEVEEQGRRHPGRVASQQQGAAAPHRPRRPDQEHQRHGAHAQRRVAEDRGAHANDVGDQRWVVQVAGREGLRPAPVIGLVERERRVGRDDGPQPHQRGDEDERATRRARLFAVQAHFTCQTNRGDVAWLHTAPMTAPAAPASHHTGRRV